MACSKSRNNLILMYVGLFFFSSLSQCTNLEKQNVRKPASSTSRHRPWRRGKLLIGFKIEPDWGSKQATHINLDYQSDEVWDVPEPKVVQPYAFPEYDNAAVERVLKMNPIVDCSGGYMRLQVNDADSRPGALLFVDRGNLTPLSLSKLPKSCGYKVDSSRQDFAMVAPYDGCFVVVQESCYVLPLSWFGLPVQMSCPLSIPPMTSPDTPMVTCHPGGMVIVADWTSPLSEIKVNLKDKWESLMQVPAECKLGAFEHLERITISIPYKTTCVGFKDGMYIVKLSGDDDVKISCPPLSSPGPPPQLMMDIEQDSTLPPTQSVKPTVSSQYDAPQSPSQTWDQFLSWYGQHPAQPGDKVVKDQFYQMYPGNVPPGLDKNVGQYPFFHPNIPPAGAFAPEPGQPPKPGYPSVDMPPLHDPMWNWPEHQPIPPFHLPHEPITTLKPDVLPTPPCPCYYTTEKPKLTTASTQTKVQHYPPFGPYIHPYPFIPPSHSTTTPTHVTQRAQDPAVSHPGTVVLFPKHPQAEMGQSLECLQHCQLGLLDCCPLIAFHQHHYHFVPPQQNGNLHFPLFPLPGLPNVLGPDLLGPQEAPAAPSATSFPNAFASPHLYPFGGRQEGQPNRGPQEGSAAAFPGNKPREQTDPPPAYFNPNAYPPYSFDINVWNPQAQPEGPSAGAHSHFSQLFKPAQDADLNPPFNVQSSHQSDDPPSKTKVPNLLPRIQQHTSQSVNENTDVKEPPLIFGRQQSPLLVPYGTLQEKHISNLQPSESMRKTRDYVLLKHGPPGRDSGKVVSVLDNTGQSIANNFPNKPLNLREESEDPKRLDLEESGKVGQTDKVTGLLPQSASANSPPLSQSPVRGQPFRYHNGLFLPIAHRHRTIQKEVSR